MKTRILFLMLLFLSPFSKLFMQENKDSCLCLPDGPIFNPSKVMIDTCEISQGKSCNEVTQKYITGLKLGKLYYTKSAIRIQFKYALKYFPPAPDDSLIIIQINDIDSQFYQIKENLLELTNKFGDFFLHKTYPRFDSGELSTIYQTRFKNYINAINFVEDCNKYDDMNCVFFGEIPYGPEYVNDLSNSNINYYPNPAENELYIEFSNPKVSSFDIKIYNHLGILKKNFTIQTNNLISNYKVDISELPSGVYFIMIDSRTYKFIKVN
jgi:hypothetical protein